MAILYLNNEGKPVQPPVTARLVANIPDPIHSYTFEFDEVANQAFVGELAHELQRFTIDRNGVVRRDGNVYALNPERPEFIERKRINGILDKAKSSPLTVPELSDIVLAIVRKLGTL